MAHYYAEPVTREPNHRGRPRLVTVLGVLPGALHHGFDGDGTPKGATVRLWEFADALPRPLPEGVEELIRADFNRAISEREAAKPPPLPDPPPYDPEEAPLTPAERKQLRGLLPQ